MLAVNVFLIAALLPFFITSFKGDGDKSDGHASPEQTVRSVNLDKEFAFCGEKFPMDNWDVRQRLDAELLRNIYFHSQTILAVKRANAIFRSSNPY